MRAARSSFDSVCEIWKTVVEDGRLYVALMAVTFDEGENLNAVLSLLDAAAFGLPCVECENVHARDDVGFRDSLGGKAGIYRTIICSGVAGFGAL